MIPCTFRAIEELQPGPKWQAIFEETWPAYERWFLKEGEDARASYATSVRMLRSYMPELVPVHERFVALAGGDDLAARLLTLYRPPAYIAFCSQGAVTKDTPVLVRNYDYTPALFEGVILSTRLGDRRVIGTSDCLWGLLDGMNDAGLVASLTFGGRRVVGDGFGIPLVVRYILETCETVAEARAVLLRLPYHMAHNLTLLDRTGDAVTAFVSPDREPVFRSLPVATNHQVKVEWPEQARVTRTVERERHIEELIEDPELTTERFARAFLRPPLHSTAFDLEMGTIYTAAYWPTEGRVEYLWPDHTWQQSFGGFVEGSHTAILRTDDGRS
jgi:predicted choloylglycine hydrolase